MTAKARAGEDIVRNKDVGDTTLGILEVQAATAARDVLCACQDTALADISMMSGGRETQGAYSVVVVLGAKGVIAVILTPS